MQIHQDYVKCDFVLVWDWLSTKHKLSHLCLYNVFQKLLWSFYVIVEYSGILRGSALVWNPKACPWDILSSLMAEPGSDGVLAETLLKSAWCKSVSLRSWPGWTLGSF